MALSQLRLPHLDVVTERDWIDRLIRRRWDEDTLNGTCTQRAVRALTVSRKSPPKPQSAMQFIPVDPRTVCFLPIFIRLTQQCNSSAWMQQCNSSAWLQQCNTSAWMQQCNTSAWMPGSNSRQLHSKEQGPVQSHGLDKILFCYKVSPVYNTRDKSNCFPGLERCYTVKAACPSFRRPGFCL